MDITLLSVIGITAGTLTTLSFVPQVIKALRTRETKDLSLPMYIVLAAGMFLWIIYGFLIQAFPVILANSVSLVFALTLVLLKLRYG